MFIGVVRGTSNRNVQLDGKSHPALVNVQCRKDVSISNFRWGMKILIRGMVNSDLSISECADFPLTILGENFDIELSNSSTDITNSPKFRHIFS